MSSEISYRHQELSAEHLAAFRAMLRVFGEAFDDADRYVSAMPSDRYLVDLLNSSQLIAIATMQGDDVVGGLVAYELPKFEQERKEIYIYDLAVLESHRRSGIATGLIARLQSIAATRGASVIFVQADAIDEPATRLYEKFGPAQQVFHYDISITTGST